MPETLSGLMKKLPPVDKPLGDFFDESVKKGPGEYICGGWYVYIGTSGRYVIVANQPDKATRRDTLYKLNENPNVGTLNIGKNPFVGIWSGMINMNVLKEVSA